MLSNLDDRATRIVQEIAFAKQVTHTDSLVSSHTHPFNHAFSLTHSLKTKTSHAPSLILTHSLARNQLAHTHASFTSIHQHSLISAQLISHSHTISVLLTGLAAFGFDILAWWLDMVKQVLTDGPFNDSAWAYLRGSVTECLPLSFSSSVSISLSLCRCICLSFYASLSVPLSLSFSLCLSLSLPLLAPSTNPSSQMPTASSRRRPQVPMH